MSAVVTERAACECGSIGRTDLWQCEHFRIFNGGRRLTSVGRIIAASFPLDPSIPSDVLENARDRGQEADQLFADWLRGKLDRMPIGTRKDSEALFRKLVRWFQGQSFSTVAVQVVLGCEDYGGVLDLRLDGAPTDLKATYNIEHTARLQVAAYDDLCGAGQRGQILHVTERYDVPRLVPLTQQDYDDWRLLRDHWRMSTRRKGNGKR